MYLLVAIEKQGKMLKTFCKNANWFKVEKSCSMFLTAQSCGFTPLCNWLICCSKVL